MSARARKRALLALLGGILVLWIALQVQHSDRAHALYARQALRVHALSVRDASGAVRIDAPGLESSLSQSPAAELVAALWPRLDMVSSCLMTDEGTRAPAVLELSLSSPGATATGVALRPLASDEGGPLDAEASACVSQALEPVVWPDAEVLAYPSALVFVLADGRLDTRARLALRRGVQLAAAAATR